MRVGIKRTTTFPWTVHSSGRYLVDPMGNPVPVLKDSCATLCAHHSPSTISKYLQKAVDLGFNCVWVMLLVRAGSGTFDTLHEPADFNNNQPFTTTDFLDTPNEIYFDYVAAMIRKAYNLGIMVELSPMYLGFGGGNQGWQTVLDPAGSVTTHNTNTICFNYGAYLGRKFGHYPNIKWMWMGDSTISGTILTKYQNIIQGIQSVTRRHLCGSELAPPDSYVTDQTGLVYGQDYTADQQIGDVYASGDAGSANGRNYNKINSKWGVLHNGVSIPLEATEPPYYANTWGSLNTRAACRRIRLWALTSGGMAYGHHYGDDDRMRANTEVDLMATMTSAQASDAAIINAFVRSLPNHLMRPSGTATGYAGRNLVVSTNPDDDNKVTACMSSDGLWMVIYAPDTGSGSRIISIDPRSMAGNYRGRWFSVTAGTYTNSAESGGTKSLSNTATSQNFATPGNDAILVLDA